MSAARLAKGALKIPKYIERGPTDILKALASTVKFVPDQPEYSLQDDPYLIPIRPSDKRIYILSKLSGQKTAKFILNKHPELFFRDDAEPKVEAFHPGEELSPDMDFTEQDIIWCVNNNDPINGVIAYKALEEKEVKLSNETLLNFFEFICYTNEENILDHIDNERSRLVNDSSRNLVDYTWKKTGLASKIFNQIRDDISPPRVYSSMIAGLSKFNEHAAARELFEEFRQKYPQKALTIEAYNGLLNSVPKLCSSVVTAHAAVDEIVQHMAENLVMPNLLTFNAILRSYRLFNCDENTCQKAFQLVNDMKTLNIEPSLSTFASLIGIITRYKNGQIHGEKIKDILDYVAASNITSLVRDETDSMFLGTAMNFIANQLNNLSLANKLHGIFVKNPNLFANPRYRTRYLNDYFKIIITTDSLENSLKFYNDYVPSYFQPSSDSYEALAEALDLYQASDEVISKIGRDLIDFKMAQNVKNDAIFRRDKSYVEALENSI